MVTFETHLVNNFKGYYYFPLCTPWSRLGFSASILSWDCRWDGKENERRTANHLSF